MYERELKNLSCELASNFLTTVMLATEAKREQFLQPSDFIKQQIILKFASFYTILFKQIGPSHSDYCD